jgi:hypothetical protein
MVERGDRRERDQQDEGRGKADSQCRSDCMLAHLPIVLIGRSDPIRLG